MQVSKPAPSTVRHRNKRYDWVGNYVTKAEAEKRKASLKRQGAKAIIATIKDSTKARYPGKTKYAVYVLHNLRGVLAK
jgi:cell division protein FtsN